MITCSVSINGDVSKYPLPKPPPRFYLTAMEKDLPCMADRNLGAGLEIKLVSKNRGLTWIMIANYIFIALAFAFSWV